VAAAPVSGEQSYVGRIVAICTPVFVLAAGATAGAVGHAIPGLQLDQSQIVALMVAVAGSALNGLALRDQQDAVALEAVDL
jgi:hypothetical protein